MTVKLTCALANVEAVEATLSITMTMKDWRDLRSQLEGHGWPSWKLVEGINLLLDKAEAKFSATVPSLAEEG